MRLLLRFTNIPLAEMLPEIEKADAAFEVMKQEAAQRAAAAAATTTAQAVPTKTPEKPVSRLLSLQKEIPAPIQTHTEKMETTATTTTTTTAAEAAEAAESQPPPFVLPSHLQSQISPVSESPQSRSATVAEMFARGELPPAPMHVDQPTTASPIHTPVSSQPAPAAVPQEQPRTAPATAVLRPAPAERQQLSVAELFARGELPPDAEEIEQQVKETNVRIYTSIRQHLTDITVQSVQDTDSTWSREHFS